MNKIDQVRALFVPGRVVICLENTYAREKGRGAWVERSWVVDSVGKSVWAARGDGGWRGTFPTRVGDVLHVDDRSATWRIGRGDHTVTYERICDECLDATGEAGCKVFCEFPCLGSMLYAPIAGTRSQPRTSSQGWWFTRPGLEADGARSAFTSGSARPSRTSDRRTSKQGTRGLHLGGLSL